MDLLSLTAEMDIAHIGPSLDQGRLPAVIYFALSAEESLGLDPYNQPALFLASKGIRVFSLNLPAHGPGLSALDAIGAWAEEFAADRDPLTPFIEKASFAIDTLIEKGLIIREKLGLMGLSRGGFIALHTMARSPAVHSTVCFAPLIQLKEAREFQEVHAPRADELDLSRIRENLIDRPIRFHMGNRDTRTGTRTCFDFFASLVDLSFEKGVRSPPLDLFLIPSIGQMGHGTSKETFVNGATWLAKNLGAIL